MVDHRWQTETGWPIVANPVGIEAAPLKPGSPTRPLPGWDVRVLDPSGEPVPAGVDGAIVVKLPLPPGALPTLWNDDDGFVASYLSAFDGYYLTGDSGHIDDDGYVFVMGRTDDGVEIHGANGYLPHQFLATNTNHRTDRYGGSIENRIRFAVEIATAVADEIGAAHTGIRISPGNPFNDIAETDTHELYPALVSALAPLDLAYLHIGHGGDDELLRTLRGIWPTALIVNRGFTDIATRVKDIDDGLADIVSVGVMALANPDLVERVRTGAPLNDPDPATFYGGGEAGYTDYPTHAA